MARFSPHYSPHKMTAFVQVLNDWLFWAIFIIGFTSLVFQKQDEAFGITDYMNVINTISIGVFFSLGIIIEFILYPLSEQTRRNDFLDNSFGSKLQNQNSEGYYSNDDVSQGLYKASCNLFENSFFTYSLTKYLTIRKIVFPTIVLIAVAVFAYYGIKKVPAGITVLQLLFSANILGNLIKHLILLNKMSNIYNDWISLFQHENLKTNILNHQAKVHQLWINYETTLSRIQPAIPDSFFKKHNSHLTDEWNKMKIRYKIN